MQPNNWPQFVLAKIALLDQQAAKLAEEAAALDRKIAFGKKLMSGASERPNIDVDEVVRQLDGHIEYRDDMERFLNNVRNSSLRAKRWLAELPSGTRLEAVSPDLQSRTWEDFDAVEKRIAAAKDEIDRIKYAPAPSPDIRERVERYVAELAKLAVPHVAGMKAGGELEVTFEPSVNVPARDYTAKPMPVSPLWAALAPEPLIALIMAQVEVAANTPMPIAERAPRIAELEREIEELTYISEALVMQEWAAGDVTLRGSHSTPQSILMVKVATSARQRAA